MHIGERIKLIRTEVGITQKELAEGIGVSNVMVSMYEQGKKEPSMQTVISIAKYFGVSADYLLGTDPALDKDTQLFLSLAKDAQRHGISFDDIKLTIETIKRLRSAGNEN